MPALRFLPFLFVSFQLHAALLYLLSSTLAFKAGSYPAITQRKKSLNQDQNSAVSTEISMIIPADRNLGRLPFAFLRHRHCKNGKLGVLIINGWITGMKKAALLGRPFGRYRRFS